MSKHKQNNDGIYFLGESSTDVTGSQYLVQFGGKRYYWNADYISQKATVILIPIKSIQRNLDSNQVRLITCLWHIHMWIIVA